MKTLFVILVVALGAASCGSDGGSHHPELVTVDVYGVKGRTLQAVEVDPFDSTTANKIKVSVTGPFIHNPITVISDFTDHEVATPPIPFGYARQVTVEVCAATCDPTVAGDIVARGRSVPFDVVEDLPSKPESVKVFVTPRNSFSSPATAKIPPEPTRPAVGDRIGATATLLNDGRILILGGARVKAGAATWFRAEDLEEVFADAEVYDPRSGQFLSVEPMTRPRAFHQAVKLSDGDVVVLGGYTQDPGAAPRLDWTVEVFDPVTGTFRASEKGIVPPGGRALFTAALLGQNSKFILIAGGLAEPAQAGSYVDVYLLDVGIVCHVPLKTTRYNHAMVYVPDYGRGTLGEKGAGVPAFILFGGQNDHGLVGTVEPVTVDPEGKCDIQNNDVTMVVLDETAIAQIPGGGRTLLAAVFVPHQLITYVIGGFTDLALRTPSDRVHIYRPDQRGFLLNREGLPMEVLVMGEARGAMSATLMDFNTILIAGGIGSGGSVTSTMDLIVQEYVCKDYEKETGCEYRIKVAHGAAPNLAPGRAAHMALFDATRRVFFVGGFSEPYVPIRDVTLYNPD